MKTLDSAERVNVQSELAIGFGKDFSKLQIAFYGQFLERECAECYGANGLGPSGIHRRCCKVLAEDILVQRRISPGNHK